MKKLLILISLIAIGFVSKAQSIVTVDSLYNTSEFQIKVRTAALRIANLKLDSAGISQNQIKFSQLVITQPQGSWSTMLTYGVINIPGIVFIEPGSSVNDIQFGLNVIWAKYSSAYYNELPDPGIDPDASLRIQSLLHDISQATTTSGTLDAGNTTLGNTVLKKQP